MTTKISGTGFDELVVDNLVLSNPLQEQYGGSGSTGVYKMGYATPKSATGTFVDFTGIPSWAKRITVMFSGVSTNGTSNLMIRIGDSGGIESTTYSSVVSASSAAGVDTTGFLVTYTIAAAVARNGVATLNNLLLSNTWLLSGLVSTTDTSLVASISSGTKSLSDILTQIRVTTFNGTDTFDAGTINVMWEGFV